MTDIRQKNRCLFCKTHRESGIAVLTAFICRDCEKELLLLSPGDSNYDGYLEEIKNLLKGLAVSESAKEPSNFSAGH